jgi:fructose-1,6-bisphosphatase/inositol monophosphatase family enzyme
MTQNHDWQHLTRFALTLAEAAGQAILPHFRKNTPIDVKEHETWDPVTEGDRAGERAIRALIEQHFPDHSILGEEYGHKQGRSNLTWVLDPVDGTRAFVIGLPTWATLIGLYENGVPKLGVMSQPFVGDMFYGNPEGAWLNHRGTTEQTQPWAPPRPISTRGKIALVLTTCAMRSKSPAMVVMRTSSPSSPQGTWTSPWMPGYRHTISQP